MLSYFYPAKKPGQEDSSVKQSPDRVTNFKQFCDKMIDFNDKNKSLALEVLAEDNLKLLSSFAKRIVDAENDDFYTKAELAQADNVKDLRSQIGKKSFTPDEINQLKDCLSIITRHEKYNAAAKDLNTDGDKNIFYVLQNHPNNTNNPANITALQSLQATWNRRSSFANISSDSIYYLKKQLDKLETYATMLKNQFNLDSYFNWSGVTENHKKVIKAYIIDLELMIARERNLLAQAMLERLALVPKDRLLRLKNSREEGDPVCDDVVIATLSELIPFGLKKEFVEKFVKIAPPHRTLTNQLMRQFNDFIGKYGSETQKSQLKKLFSNAVPTLHPGHNHLDIPINPNLMFSVIEVKSDDDVKKKLPSVEGFDNLGKSFLSETVKEFELLDQSIHNANDVEQPNIVEEPKINDSFIQVPSDESINSGALQKPDPINQNELLEKSTLEGSFCEVPKEKANVPSLNDSFIQLSNSTVEDPADPIAKRIAARVKSLEEEIIAEQGISEIARKKTLEYFKKEVAQQNPTLATIDNILLHAELKTFIYSNNDFSLAYRVPFEQLAIKNVKKINNWENQPDRDAWIKAMQEAKNVINEQINFSQFLKDERKRIVTHKFNFLMSQTKTDAKLATIDNCMPKIAICQDIDALHALQKSMIKTPEFTQRRSIFSCFSMFDSTSKKRLDNFIQQNATGIKNQG